MKKEEIIVDASTYEKLKEVVNYLLSIGEEVYKSTIERAETGDVRVYKSIRLHRGKWNGNLDDPNTTLEELKQFLTPKIKKSELQKRIEVLEEKVAELEEIAKVTIENEVENSKCVKSDKPQFEVGKVYKLYDTKIMFYCTDASLDVYGFGFDKNGRWTEKSFFSTSNLTEATHEEWFKRLEEEAKKRGFVKGARIGNCMNDIVGLIGEDISYSFYILRLNEFTLVDCVKSEKGINNNWTIMKDGKWAEIIEEPQRMTVEQRDELAKPFSPDEYQIGTIGIFWDGDFEEKMSRGNVIFGELDHITENGHFRPKGKSWSWDNFKPLKFD